MKKIILFLLLFFSSQLHILAASFDCAKATRQLDIQICESPVLSELDTEMAVLYARNRSTRADPNKIRSEQRQWLAKRDRCQNSACLRQEYEQRIQQLRQPQTSAQEALQMPTFTADVVDQTSTLDENQRNVLEIRLAKIKQYQDTHIVVLIVESTAPEDINAFSNRVANTWDIGRTTKTKKGVLIVVAKQDRRMRIEIAKSLEDAIPDSEAARIIEQTMMPKFRENDFAGGLSAAIDQLGFLVEKARIVTTTQEEEKITELKKIEAKKQRAEKKRLRIEREQFEAERERTDILKNIIMWLGGALTLTALAAAWMFRREIFSSKPKEKPKLSKESSRQETNIFFQEESPILPLEDKLLNNNINKENRRKVDLHEKFNIAIKKLPISPASRKIIKIIFYILVLIFIATNFYSKIISISTSEHNKSTSLKLSKLRCANDYWTFYPNGELKIESKGDSQGRSPPDRWDSILTGKYYWEDNILVMETNYFAIVSATPSDMQLARDLNLVTSKSVSINYYNVSRNNDEISLKTTKRFFNGKEKDVRNKKTTQCVLIK